MPTFFLQNSVFMNMPQLNIRKTKHAINKICYVQRVMVAFIFCFFFSLQLLYVNAFLILLLNEPH